MLSKMEQVCKVYGCQVVKFDSLGLETCLTTFVSMSMLQLFIGDCFLPTLYVPLYHVYSTASHLAIRRKIMLTGIILYYLHSNLIEVVTVQCIVE